MLEYHWGLTLFIMGLSLIVFGVSSFNIFFYFKANITLILEHGIAALRDGALEQFFWLLLSGAIALASYLVFKACEKILVDWMLK